MNTASHNPNPTGSESGGPLIETLTQHPFLAGLKPQHVRLLAQNAMPVDYAAGEFLLRRGDLANRFYLIQQGCVAVESPRPAEPPVEIERLGSGEVLGWSWLFPPYRWHFDARALKPTRAIFLYGTRLREECENDPEFGFELMRRINQVVVQRLQHARLAPPPTRRDPPLIALSAPRPLELTPPGNPNHPESPCPPTPDGTTTACGQSRSS
jgi:CRP/FNR family transcriptional regulator, cyclic AMP receptor protein